MATLFDKINWIYPGEFSPDDFLDMIVLVNDGRTERIKAWNHPTLPCPSLAQLEAASPPPPDIAKERAAKLAEVNDKAQAVVAGLLKAYPDFEMRTWHQQEAEATAWHNDSTAATPMIDIMAFERGLDRTVFLQRTYDKVMQFRQISAKLIGQRQKYEDQLNAASTVEAVAAVNPVYVL